MTVSKAKARRDGTYVHVPKMSYPTPTIETMKTTKPCPNHEGSFDCTPFCNLCEGNQEHPTKEKAK